MSLPGGAVVPATAIATMEPFIACGTGGALGPSFDMAVRVTSAATEVHSVSLALDVTTATVYAAGVYQGASLAVAGVHAAPDSSTEALTSVTGARSVFVAAVGTSTGAVKWVRSVPATGTATATAVSGVALAAGGRVVVAVDTQSPLQVAPHRAPVGPQGSHAPQSFTVLAQLFTASGASATASVGVVGDPSPQVPQASQIGASALITAPSGGVVTPASDMVLLGAARGTVANSRAATSPQLASAASGAGNNGHFLLFAAPTGIAAADAATFAPFYPDASSLPDLRGTGTGTHMAVQMEVWRSGGAGAIAGGSWTAADGSGVSFRVDAAGQAAQATLTRAWVPVEGVAIDSMSGPGNRYFGAVGGALLSDLSRLSLSLGPGVQSRSAQYQVRNVRLVPRGSTCVPCGEVPVRDTPAMLWRPAAAAGDMIALRELEPLLLAPVDATTIIDPSCNCLRGAELQWWQPVADDVTVSHVDLTSPDGGAGVLGAAVTYGGPTADGWVQGTATIRLHDHANVDNVDWRSVTRVTLHPHIQHTAVNDTVLVVEGMVLQRPCPSGSAVLHPKPETNGTEVPVSRSRLGLSRGSLYRVLAVDTNMFGDDGAPTCSRPFVVDDTPPEVTDAAAIDIEPSPISEYTDQAYTRHRVLSLGWTGTYDEPDSAPDNILLYRVHDVRRGTPDGPVVRNSTAPASTTVYQSEVPDASTHRVHTGVMSLEDGTKYFATLAVCNVRTQSHVCVCEWLCGWLCQCVAVHACA